MSGRKQFELHQTVNPDDVENAAWHFICVAKAEGVEAARKALIPIKGDARIPMAEVHDLFAGKGTEESVHEGRRPTREAILRAKITVIKCAMRASPRLYHEALGHEEKAREHLVKAATTYKMDHYMGKTAQVHMKLRGWKQ